jgi:hypothetical protein
MSTELPMPTVDLVNAAAKKFDKDYRIGEQSLGELFSQYHENTDLSHVLWKVALLIPLYQLHIPAYAPDKPNLLDVASHIHQNAEEIDSALALGLPEIVDKIARVVVPPGKKPFYHYSFASKYCSWHNPCAYPIYDFHVKNYLWSLKEQGRFTDAAFLYQESLKDYPTFFKIMTGFRKSFGLESLSFKDIDKFLYLDGGGSPVEEPSEL